MTIKVGDRVPDGTLTEFIETVTAGCSLGPNAFLVADLTRGKTIALFAVPGAFTPTCSAKHLPGYVEQAAALKAKGIDEIWCVSVNDAFVMGAWGREQKTDGKVRMLADGSALWTKALGLELDLERLEVLGDVTGGVGVGHVLGDHPLALRQVAEPATQHRKERDLGQVHAEDGE